MTFTECIMNLSSLINWMCVNQVINNSCDVRCVSALHNKHTADKTVVETLPEAGPDLNV